MTNENSHSKLLTASHELSYSLQWEQATEKKYIYEQIDTTCKKETGEEKNKIRKGEISDNACSGTCILGALYNTENSCVPSSQALMKFTQN